MSRSLAQNVDEARRAILAGQIRDPISGIIFSSGALRVSESQALERKESRTYVGRGYLKLKGLSERFFIEPRSTSAWALDIGSSTGGFTERLLELGFQRVVAVDVGRGQLHDKLRSDIRVIVKEETDVRELRSEDFSSLGLEDDPQIVTVDISFNSLTRVVPTLLSLAPMATYLFLFKPQFEVARSVPKPKGRAPLKESEESLKEMLLFLRRLGLDPLMVQTSTLKGREGNQETFIVAQGLPRSIFRSYDIRGVGERDLTNEVVARIGLVYGAMAVKSVNKASSLKKPIIGVGRDGRLSSPRIFSALTRALSKTCEVVELGEIPTPMAYFAHYHFNLDGIIQITASHNPKDDNGFKMMLGRETLFGEQIVELYEEARRVECPEDLWQVQTPVEMADKHAELLQAYEAFLLSSIPLKRKWKIALDCGNGMAGVNARAIFSTIASDLQVLHETVDCRFPNHEADPTVAENLSDLIQLVKSDRFDVGFAFDGDADRLGVVSRKGRILWGDEILMLLSQVALKKYPGATIIGEVKCSEKLFRHIKHCGGQPLMYMTGHSLIKKKMKEVKAPIAGEMSGHLFFADRYFGFDDATYAALRVMEALELLETDLDSWIEAFPASYVTPELRLPCLEAEKLPLVEKVKKAFLGRDLSLNTIDGVRVGYPDGSWALVRASNTQAVLVIRIEGSSEQRIQEIKQELEEALDKEIPS